MRTSALAPVLTVLALLASGNAYSAVQSRVEPDELRKLSGPIASGARVKLERIAVGDTVRTFDLERFEVWAPNAEIVVDHPDGSRTRLAPPPVQYFRGTVDGDPDSMVFLAVGSDGTADGLVVADDVRYKMRSQPSREVMIEEADPLDDMPIDGSFTCDLDRVPMLTARGVPKVRADARPAAEGTLTGTGSWTLNLAIETDFELYQDMGSNATTVTTFIGNVVGAASTIYKRDLSTDLVISFSRVQAAVSDPFTVVPGAAGTWNGSATTYSTSHALAELGDIWANAGTRPFNGARSSVVLLSGKSQTAGVAWIGTSCGGDFACSGGSCGSTLFDGHTGGGYAYIGLGNPSTTVPNPDATVGGVQYGLPATNYWPVLGLSHELGHNVDGPHTHCFALSAQDKATYGVTRNFIDECYSGQSGSGCSGAPQTVPAEKGTVMSYCHLLGSSQSRFLFGKAGETSELMKNHIRTYINSVTPASPSLSAPASLGPGASSTASVVSPNGALTYTWTITNGTINGSTTGTSVNFTANTNPVTLRAKGTSSNGCAASESINVTVTSCTAPTITSVTPSITITNGTTIELLAAAGGTGPITYQWYVGSSGNTSTPAAAGNPINVTPGVTTSYWVRATNSCGSADSATVTLTVVVPPTTPTALYIVTPCRVIDTRNPTGPFGGPALASGATRDIQMTTRCGIPSGAQSVVANVTAVSPAANGTLSFFPTGISWPGTSNMSYRTGKTRAANSILFLSGAGQVTIYNVGATQHFIIDVTGYFQ